jgi:dipeptidyl aminopeptidase/acylaminoacyl peptidase
VVTADWDRSVSSFTVSKDGGTVYIEAEDSGFDQLFQVPSSGGAVQRLVQVDRGGYTALRQAGTSFVALFQTSLQPPELVRLNPPSGGRTQLTQFNAERISKLDAPDLIHFWFTASNGKRIHNVMALPPAFDPGKKYPLVIFPHGGPNSMSKDSFSTRWNTHLLASPGYVVLQTNSRAPRGSASGSPTISKRTCFAAPRRKSWRQSKRR